MHDEILLENYCLELSLIKEEQKLFESLIGYDFLEVKALREDTLLENNDDGIVGKIIAFINKAIELIKKSIENLKTFFSKERTKDQEMNRILDELDIVYRRKVDVDNLSDEVKKSLTYIDIDYDFVQDLQSSRDKAISYLKDTFESEKIDTDEVMEKLEEIYGFKINSKVQDTPIYKKAFSVKESGSATDLIKIMSRWASKFDERQDILINSQTEMVKTLGMIKAKLNKNKNYSGHVVQLINFCTRYSTTAQTVYQTTINEISDIVSKNVTILNRKTREAKMNDNK